MNGPVTPLAVDTLSESRALQIILALLIAAILVGVLILISRSVLSGRSGAGDKESGTSVVRSWIAIILVLGLLVFVTVSFTLTNPDTRNILVGALAANVGGAVAFYFSSKASDEARKDILNATFGMEKVPDLQGLTQALAQAQLGTTSFALSVDPKSAGTDPATDVVVRQLPAKDAIVRKGTTIMVSLGPKT